MKNVFFVFAFILIQTVNLFAAYLQFEPVNVTQPDGKILNIYASGDEFYNWLHDKDGYTIIQNSLTGYYVYALLDGDKCIPSNYVVGYVNPAYAGLHPYIMIPEEIIQQKRNKFFAESPANMGAAPKTGTINNLVVYIRFADETEFTDSSAFYNRMFNNIYPGYNSMHNYFKEVSYGALTINTHFFPVSSTPFVASFKDSLPRSYYKPFDSISNPNGYTSSNKTSREHNLLRRAIQYIAPQVPDTLNLDGDNDGNVDNVCFIVYGSSTAWADLLWPHRWALYSYTVNIRGKRVFDYNFQLQNSLKSSGVGVLCHEMFHSLGSPDLYHYTSNGINPCYRWDVMDANMNPPEHMGAHMKMKYGTWISSIPTISTPGTYTLKPITSPTNNAYKIISPYSSIEYYVVEYRKKNITTFESSIPGTGLLIYRINSTRTGNSGGPPDEVYIYRPDGTVTANGNPSLANFSSNVSRTSINKNTNPSPFLLDGVQGGLNIYNVSSSDSTISFNLGEPTGIENTSYVQTFKLEQNFPNPFNNFTVISYQLNIATSVKISVFDINGKEIITLVNTKQNPGSYNIKFNAENLSSGIYFYKLTTDNFSDIKRMSYIK